MVTDDVVTADVVTDDVVTDDVVTDDVVTDDVVTDLAPRLWASLLIPRAGLFQAPRDMSRTR